MPTFSLKCPGQSIALGIFVGTALSYLISSYSFNRKEVIIIPHELQGTILDRELRAAIDVALQAGRNISDAIQKSKNISSKDDLKVDFVTDTDRGNEMLIFSELKRLFPTHLFIGEEASAEQGCIDELTGIYF